MGWQSGIRSGVFFAAMTPARRAAASTSPFSDSPRRTMPAVAGVMATRPRATATRSVFSFDPTSIIFTVGLLCLFGDGAACLGTGPGEAAVP